MEAATRGVDADDVSDEQPRESEADAPGAIQTSRLPRQSPSSVFCYRRQRPNLENLTGKTNGWKAILNTLTVHYGDRIADHIR